MNTFVISHAEGKHSLIISSMVAIPGDIWQGLCCLAGKPPVVSLNEDRTIKHYAWEFADEAIDYPQAYSMLVDAGWEVGNNAQQKI